MTDQQVIEYYRSKIAEQQAAVDRCASRWSRMGYLRGGSFLLSLLPLILALNSVWGITTGWLILAACCFWRFCRRVPARRHAVGTATGKPVVSDASRIYRSMRARMDRNPRARNRNPQSFLPISTDLDLLGENSVYKLLAITRTPLGTETLRSWIIDGALPAEIKLRQDAVAELAQRIRLAIEIPIALRNVGGRPIGAQSVCRMVGKSELVCRLSLGALAGQADGGRFALAIGLLVAGFLPLTIAGPTLMLTCAINFLLSVFYAGTIHDVFNRSLRVPTKPCITCRCLTWFPSFPPNRRN